MSGSTQRDPKDLLTEIVREWLDALERSAHALHPASEPLRNLPPDRWPTLLAREHLGDIFSCSQRTVSRLLSDELPSILLGGTRYVRRDTLIKFLADREREPVPAARRRKKGATIPRRGRIREGRSR